MNKVVIFLGTLFVINLIAGIAMGDVVFFVLAACYFVMTACYLSMALSWYGYCSNGESRSE